MTQLNLPSCGDVSGAGAVCAGSVAVRHNSPNPGLITDCENLLAAKSVLIGSGTVNWSENLDMKSWEGVALKGEPMRVREVHLRARNLTGIVPREFGGLSALVRIDLAHNEFSGQIPEELGNLGNLESLFLAGNRLSGHIPASIGQMQSLKSLGLDGNDLAGQIPSELMNLNAIEFLALSDNHLTGEIPAAGWVG